MSAVMDHVCLGLAQRFRHLIGLRQQIQETEAARQLLVLTGRNNFAICQC